MNSPTLGVGSPISTDNGVDTAMSVSGSSQKVSLPSLTTPKTVEAWVKFVSPDTRTLPVFSNRDSNLQTNKSMMFFGVSDGKVFSYVNARSPIPLIGTSRVDDGNWHYIAYSWDGTTGKIYVDGRQETSTAQSDSQSPYTAAGAIGYDLPNVSYFSGAIDEVAIYSTALSGTRIAAHYSASGWVLPPMPVFTRSAYASAVLENRPTAYWRLSETSGTAANDASPNGKNATYSGSPTLGAAGPLIGEPSDRAVTFNGSSQRANGPQLTTPGTIEAWVKLSTNTGTLPVFSNRDSQATQSMIFFGTSGGKAFSYVNSRSPAPLTGTTRIDDGAWHQIAYSWDGSTGKIYVDGQLQTSSTQSDSQPRRTATGYVGYDLPNGSYFAGSIDDVALYANALPASELLDHFNTGTKAAEPIEQSFGACAGGDGPDAKSPSECLADPVNSLTGAYTDSATDLTLPGIGVTFALSRSYTSADSTASRLGPGWTDNYAESLAIQANGDAVLHGADGQQVTYAKQSNGSYLSAAGAMSTLTLSSGIYKLTKHDQTVASFDANGRLSGIVDRNGQGVALAYDGSGQLATVTDATSHQVTFTSNADGTLHQAQLADGTHVTYGYTTGRLTSVTDPLGKTSNYTYDASGKLATEVDPNGHTVVSNVYGDYGRVSQQTDAVGNTTSFHWDPSTETATATDANGNVWTDVYSGNVLISQADPQGHTTQFAHNSKLDGTSVAAPTGATTTMTYDSNGNLLTATAPASLGSIQKTFTYDAQNNVKTVTDGRGKVTSYSYDTAGNLTSVTLDGAQISSFTFNANGQKLTATDGNSKTTTYTYDTSGNVASVTDPLGSKTTYTYDTQGRVLTKVDPLGNISGGTPADYTTSYTYDANGNLLTETDPLSHTTTHTYDDAGNQTSVTDPNGDTTTYAYDHANKLVSVTSPDPDGTGALAAPITTYTYDSVGNQLTKVDPRGNVQGATPADYTTTYTYNSSNRLASVTRPEGGKTTYTYDANGNLASSVDPRGNVQGANPADYTTSYSYDAATRLLTQTDPLGHATTYTYDAAGNKTTMADAKSRSTSYTYDAAGRLLTVTAPDTGVTSNTYDGNGNVASRTDAKSHTTSYTYDGVGRLTQVTGPDPDGAAPLAAPATSYTYDANGRRTTITDPNGNTTQTSGDGTTSYSYDHAGRLTSIGYSDSTPSVTFAYDAAGNRTAMSDGGGTVNYVYDHLARPTNITRSSDVFSYTYDSSGDLTSRSYPDGTQTSYTYNKDNLLASATTNSAVTSYVYNAAGELTQTTLPSGNGYVETRSYDKAGRLIDVKNAAGTSVLTDFAATLDPVGNPTEIDRSGAVSSTTTYDYDANDRLTSVCFQATCPNSNDPFIRWTYDKVGNRLTEARPAGTTTYTYNAADELTSDGTISYSYDANGNQTAAGPTNYTYDLENRLASVNSGSTTTTYSYDGVGNRLQAATGTGASQITNYLWDTNRTLPQIALERDGNNTVSRRYEYGANRISMTSGGNTYYYHYDTLGSVVNVTSSTGATDWTYSYEPFGATRTATQSDPNATTNEMQFAGELLDPTVLYYLRARQYDPTNGRFSSIDPAAQTVAGISISKYVYVADRPTLMVDPSGETFSPSHAGTSACRMASSPNDTTRTLAGLNPAPPPGVPSCRRATLAGSGGWVRFWMSRRGNVFWEASMYNPLLNPGFWEEQIYWDTLYIATSVSFNAPSNQQIRTPLPGTIITVSGYHDDILGARHPVQGSCFVPF